ncbi:MAG: hypothetical protein AB7P67_05635 [Vicinamibacterales bacterium]
MPPALLAPLLTALAAVQSHWLDDLGSGAPDTAGLAVSGLASALLLAGWLAWPRRTARYGVGAGWVFTGWVSIADLVGMGPDGRLAPSILEHWTAVLGPAVGVAVAVALAASAWGLWTLWRGAGARPVSALDG